MLSAQKERVEPLLVSGASEIKGPVLNDTIVRRNCSLHVRGSLKGDLTIEPGAKVVVEGSVEGRITNKGGNLVVNNNVIVDYLGADGPPEALAGAVLRVDLSAIVRNWSSLAKRCLGCECAAVVKADAYGCGLDRVAPTLAKYGCGMFFVSDLAEAKRVRAGAANATIYVLGGFHPGAADAFAELDARPVITSLIELAEWDVFVAATGWAGGFALHVDTGISRRGVSLEEAAAVASRVRAPSHGVQLLMSHLDCGGRPDQSANERQIKRFRELRRLFPFVPASLANSSGIFVGANAHCDLVRPGAALFGVNPVPGLPNPMLLAVELKARIGQVRSLAPGESLAFDGGWTAKRPTRLAVVALGYADGYPLPGIAPNALRAIVGGHASPLIGRAMDLLAVDVTDVPDPKAARRGEMVTLIGGPIGVDDVALAAKSNAREVLSNLGRRFHRIYHSS